MFLRSIAIALNQTKCVMAREHSIAKQGGVGFKVTAIQVRLDYWSRIGFVLVLRRLIRTSLLGLSASRRHRRAVYESRPFVLAELRYFSEAHRSTEHAHVMCAGRREVNSAPKEAAH
jgi:hypothetical protein